MTDPAPPPYRVLARKYRPQTFAELLGQDALVRTLTNAIRSGRLAHAFLLTGVRGVGKTTTARILARALNCIGPDGTGGPTAEPCGRCEPCVAIAADRHVDVLELDAASRTGVDDVREIIDGVRYKPVSARYRVYIVDEVHMLSRNAFNALLKTLEEPPEHTKFVFATTELRKIPVTVLSRCQRFDLRRVEPAELARHFTAVAEQEGTVLEAPAAALLARAADGSVRDGLSLLDQAIVLAAAAGEGTPMAAAVDAGLVRGMLGLADRDAVTDLFEAVMQGGIAKALAQYAELHRGGADPLTVLQDLLELCHAVTRHKLGTEPDDAVGAETARLAGLAEALPVPALTRAWQILLKGVAEVQHASDGRAALDMVLVRLAFVADLPSPADLVRRLAGAPAGAAHAAAPAGAPAAAGAPVGRGTAMAVGAGLASARVAPQPDPPLADPPLAAAPLPAAAPAAVPAVGLADPQSFADLVELFGARREPVLRGHLVANVHLVHFEPGRLEFRPSEQAPRDLAQLVGQRLADWTGRRWVISLASAGGAATLRQQTEATAARRLDAAAAHPLVQAVLDAFPGARIEAVRPLKPGEEPDAAATLVTDDAEDAADGS